MTVFSGAEQAVQLRPVHLFTIYLDTATIRISDAHKELRWGGDTWLAGGHALGFTGLEETSALEVTTVTISLSAVDQSFISLLLAQHFIDRRVTIHLALLDEDDRLTIAPRLQFDGRVDSPVIADDPVNGKSVIALSATNHWVDFERVPGRHTNGPEQRLYYAGDKGFDFIPQLVSKVLLWGRT